MKFRIGPWNYRVRISADPLTDETGNALASLPCWKGKLIWLANHLNQDERLDALMYALAKAWRNHFGQSANDDDAANRQSTFSIDMHRQLEMQGGAWALARLNGLATIRNSSLFLHQIHHIREK